MSVRSELRAVAASAFYEIAMDVGVAISYIAAGSSPVNIFGVVRGGGTSVDEGGASRLVEEISISIPRQPSFPPIGGIQIYDVLSVDSVSYSVLSFDSDSLDAVFILTAKRTTLNI